MIVSSFRRTRLFSGLSLHFQCSAMGPRTASKDSATGKKRKSESVSTSAEKSARPKTSKLEESGKTSESVDSPPRKTGKSNKPSSGKAGGSVSEVQRRDDGTLIFDDHPDFRPNLSPKDVLQLGSFGGTYFRPIKSSVTGESYKDEWKELPADWLEGLSVPRQVASSVYVESVNRYKSKCGGSLEMWEESGWIRAQDPYGWFQWYCRFYQGRRTEDDERQLGRWQRCTGLKGRWRQNLITKVVRSGCGYDSAAVSPVVRQTLQHWGYQLTEADYQLGAQRVKKT